MLVGLLLVLLLIFGLVVFLLFKNKQPENLCEKANYCPHAFPSPENFCPICKENYKTPDKACCEDCENTLIDNFNSILDESLFGLANFISPKILERILIDKIFNLQNGKYLF